MSPFQGSLDSIILERKDRTLSLQFYACQAKRTAEALDGQTVEAVYPFCGFAGRDVALQRLCESRRPKWV